MREWWEDEEEGWRVRMATTWLLFDHHGHSGEKELGGTFATQRWRGQACHILQVRVP